MTDTVSSPRRFGIEVGTFHLSLDRAALSVSPRNIHMAFPEKPAKNRETFEAERFRGVHSDADEDESAGEQGNPGEQYNRDDFIHGNRFASDGR